MAVRLGTGVITWAAWLALALGVARADQTVSFASAVYPPTPFQVRQALQKRGKPETRGLMLSGRLTIPGGDGPYPAIVVLHGCAGIWRWNEVWSRRLAKWGYVVLDVDSLGPRGKTSVCGTPGAVSGPMRALDAHGAKSYLANLPEVDPGRIAVIGMSHGGWATLEAIRKSTTSELGLPPFRAAIALYPWCDEPAELDTPLLVLVGELDDWSPASQCRTFAAGAVSSSEVDLTVYPGAHHLFDLPGIDTREQGHVLRYDPRAADDAVRRIAGFLAEYL